MDTSRLGTGTTIAAIAAIVLLVSMFLGWFQLDSISAEGDFGGVPGSDIEFGGDELQAAAESAGEDTKANAWESFSLIDIVLALAVAAALALAATRAGTAAVRLPVPLATIVAALGALGALLILFRIISPPDLLGAFGEGVSDTVEVETDVGRQLFVFVGLLASLGIAYGGWRAMQDEGTTARPAGGAAAAPPPPQPPAGGAAPPPPAPGTTPPPPGTPGAPPPSGPTA